MRAIKFLEIGRVAEVETGRPVVGPGQALLRVTAAGVCKTDVRVRAADRKLVPFGTTLGHEIAGTIVELAGISPGLAVDDPVVVLPMWSCGACTACVAGRENACRGQGGRHRVPPAPGMSVDGGMADYVVVPVTSLVPAHGIDPALAAVLPDAGLVPFHAINDQRDLLRAGTVAIVIGVGGLGQFAIATLRALTAASVIAIDLSEDSLAAVADRVDHTFRADAPDLAAQILDAVGEYGVDFVLDLIGSDASLALAGDVIAPYGAIRVPGLGGGVYTLETAQNSRKLPFGVSLARTYGGTKRDLHELVALARSGRLEVDLQRYDFADAMAAFDDLDSGRVRGRAVLVMSQT